MRWVNRALMSAQAGPIADRFCLAHVNSATALSIAMTGADGGSAVLQALQDTDPSRSGRWPGLYCGNSIRDLLGNNKDPILGRYWLWLVAYGPVAAVPHTWEQWTFWQHTDGHLGTAPHVVPGCGPCHRDRFAGNAEALTASLIDNPLDWLRIRARQSPVHAPSVRLGNHARHRHTPRHLIFRESFGRREIARESFARASVAERSHGTSCAFSCQRRLRPMCRASATNSSTCPSATMRRSRAPC